MFEQLILSLALHEGKIIFTLMIALSLSLMLRANVHIILSLINV